MEYRNGTCGVGNNTRSKGSHMTCTIIQREKYQKRAVDIEIDKDRCSSQVEGVMHYIQYYELSATSLCHKYSKASKVSRVIIKC